MTTSLIRPGLLVSLKTAIRGGVTYQKVTIEAEHELPDASKRARWETTRNIANAEEFEAARIVRGQCRWLITAACCQSTFGLLCPVSKETQLQDAIKEAQRLADKHNASANFSRVDVFVLTGRVADNDEQAARAIGAEVLDLIAAMEAGVAKADPAAIRDAATKARGMAGMLSEDVQKKVSEAVEEVRSAARTIVARVEKAGESAAIVLDELKLDRLKSARFAVLDLSEFEDSASSSALMSPATARALDFEPQATGV